MEINKLSLAASVSRFFDEEERNGLERRQGQVEMSLEVAQAIMANRSLIVEAEVGIGKSVAYIVPIEWFVKHGIRVWSVQEGEQRFEDHVDKLMNYIRFWQASGESEKTSMRIKTRMQ